MMLRISRLVLGLLICTQVGKMRTNAETHKQCHDIKTDGVTIIVTEPYIEVSPSSQLTLGCRVCSQKHHKIKVFWERNGSALAERAGVRLKHKHKSLYQLVVKKAHKEHLGEYTCVVNKNIKQTFHVGFVPVPPKLLPVADGLNSTEQELEWEVTHASIIINYEVKLRRAPVSGRGEDWVSVHVPAREGNHHTSRESYLLRGLEMGTTYQVKVRARNKYGYSHYSQVCTFSTYSPFTTTTQGPTRAPQLINWRDNQQFSKNLLENQLPASSQIINTHPPQEHASSSGSVGGSYLLWVVVVWLALCVV